MSSSRLIQMLFSANNIVSLLMNLQGLSLQTFTMVAIVPTQIHNIHIQTEQLI